MRSASAIQCRCSGDRNLEKPDQLAEKSKDRFLILPFCFEDHDAWRCGCRPGKKIRKIEAENSIRPFALVRTNWRHLGSVQAGPKVAAILTVEESCRRMNLPVRDYLVSILPGLADSCIRKVPEPLPPPGPTANGTD